jgi:hypothetical protein
LVGLDVSYHGRSTHGEGGNEIKKEYIDAYNRYKSTVRHRHHGQNNSNPDRQQAEATAFPHPNNTYNATEASSGTQMQHDEEQQQQQQQQEYILSGGEQEQDKYTDASTRSGLQDQVVYQEDSAAVGTAEREEYSGLFKLETKQT